MAKTKDVERVMVTVRLPKELVKAAKHHAVDTEQDFQDVLAEALRAFLARKGGAR
jgi:predicted transcriptional regulator